MRTHRWTGVLAATALALTTLVGTAGTADAATTPGRYKNCTSLNKVYKHGVGKAGARDHVRGKSKPVKNFTRSTKAYKAAVRANKRLDADHDGIACERH